VAALGPKRCRSRKNALCKLLRTESHKFFVVRRIGGCKAGAMALFFVERRVDLRNE
jgi:hypothetical protein